MHTWTNIETSLAPPGGERVPGRPDALSAEWLTACLRHAGELAATARVASFTAERIGQGDGFAGQIVRVALRYEPEDVAGPRTLVAKFATEHAPTRQLLAAFAGYAREVRFYRELAPRIGIATPRCYFAHYDRVGGEFLLLLEDMAPSSTVDIELGLSVAQAELVLDQLAEMHARFWGRTGGLEWLELSPELIAAMRERFVAALPGFIARYGAQYPQIARAARHMEVLLGDEQLIAQMRKPPLTLAHNDVHVNNLLLPGDGGGRFALIDWQSITMSRHGTTDVARVLSVCIAPELRRKSGRALLGYYHARLRARGVRGYGRLALEYRLRQEMTAMVIVGVLAYDTLDFAGEHGERTADLMGARIEAAIADARVSSLLGALVVWLRCKRWLHGVFGARRQIGGE
jgi:hypothetical protein